MSELETLQAILTSLRVICFAMGILIGVNIGQIILRK
jgi:hypothetical protein